MQFVGLDRDFFEIDEVERCEPRVEDINNPRGGKIPTQKYYAILKTGKEISISLVDFKSISNLLNIK